MHDGSALFLRTSLGLPPFMAALPPMAPDWLTDHMEALGRWFVVSAAQALPSSYLPANVAAPRLFAVEVHGGQGGFLGGMRRTSLILAHLKAPLPPQESLLAFFSPEDAYRGLVCATGRSWEIPACATNLLIRGAGLDGRFGRLDPQIVDELEDLAALHDAAALEGSDASPEALPPKVNGHAHPQAEA